MKKRLHNKKAGVAILVALIILSFAEVVFRAAAMGLEAVLTTANFGEQLAVIALAVTILILTAKGKDRACYILYGAWLACFVMDQIFGLPGMIVTMITTIAYGVNVSIIIRVVVMICIIAIGALLLEYMNDGTIYNRAFNALCIIAVLLLVANISVGIYNIAFNEPLATLPNGIDFAFFKNQIALDLFNKGYHVIMIFLFAFFAYDSAKLQLKKVKITK